MTNQLLIRSAERGVANPDLVPGSLQKGYRPRDAAKLTRAELRVKLDKAENKKVKERSGGRCEVYRVVKGGWSGLRVFTSSAITVPLRSIT
jgi:hypothetical protein